METNNMKKMILFLSISIATLGTVSAATYLVDIVGGGDFTNIQDAIDAASDGDVIIVNSGVHHINTALDGVITVDKELTIQGSGYDLPENGGTTIRSNNSIFTFTAAAEGSTLRGFRLKGAGTPMVTISANEMVIENNLFMCVSGNNTYALHLNSVSTDTIRNNIFCPGEGGASSSGIYLNLTSNVLINNNLFAGITGTGLYATRNSNDKILNNVFAANSGYSLQIGYLNNTYADHAYVGGNIFMNNTNTGLNYQTGSPTITNNCFYNNSPDGTVGLESLTQNPLFVNFTTGHSYDEESYDSDNYDFHLNTGSPAIDVGPQLPEYRDLDGSLNDMGMYGWLWPTGTNGAPAMPLINQISVTPTGVAPGETISIEVIGRFGE